RQVRCDRPFIGTKVQRQEMLSSFCVQALAQMQQETRFALQPSEKFRRTLGFHISDPCLSLGQVLVVGLFYIAHDSPVEASDACVAKERDALTGRHTSH